MQQSDPADLNNTGLDYFASGRPSKAEEFLKLAFEGMPEQKGILVNLDLFIFSIASPDKTG